MRQAAEFQSTPPARAATTTSGGLSSGYSCFNPRRPRGRRQASFDFIGARNWFQSTPPARAATQPHTRLAIIRRRFNPRRPRGRRPESRFHRAHAHAVSIHAAREGGDGQHVRVGHCQQVSIHAAREGGDPATVDAGNRPRPFQSTPPARAATGNQPHARHRARFQSTPPARAATILAREPRHVRVVSIHAAREGGDETIPAASAPKQSFNPRRPRGRRPLDLYSCPRDIQFQSTPPARAATGDG